MSLDSYHILTPFTRSPIFKPSLLSSTSHYTPSPYIIGDKQLHDTANDDQEIGDDGSNKPHVVERQNLMALEMVIKLGLEEGVYFPGQFQGAEEGAGTL